MIHQFFLRLFLATAFACIVLMCCARASDQTPQIMLVVAYKDGAPVAAQAIGFSPDLKGCQMGLEAELADIAPKDGITFVAVCTPTPPPRK